MIKKWLSFIARSNLWYSWEPVVVKPQFL